MGLLVAARKRFLGTVHIEKESSLQKKKRRVVAFLYSKNWVFSTQNCVFSSHCGKMRSSSVSYSKNCVFSAQKLCIFGSLQGFLAVKTMYLPPKNCVFSGPRRDFPTIKTVYSTLKSCVLSDPSSDSLRSKLCILHPKPVYLLVPSGISYSKNCVFVTKKLCILGSLKGCPTIKTVYSPP